MVHAPALRQSLERWQALHFNMRLATVAAVFFSSLVVSAEFVQPNATDLSELLTELYELPTCAVCTIFRSLR